MDNLSRVERQGQPVGARHPHTNLMLIWLADGLEEAIETIANGECISAIERLRDIWDEMRDVAACEKAAIKSLEAYHPLFDLDQELHKVRRKVVENRVAKHESWRVNWEGESAQISGPGFFANIDRCDNWEASSGKEGWDCCGHGLVSFIAYLDGEHVAIVAAKVSRWLDRRRAAK